MAPFRKFVQRGTKTPVPLQHGYWKQNKSPEIPVGGTIIHGQSRTQQYLGTVPGYSAFTDQLFCASGAQAMTSTYIFVIRLGFAAEMFAVLVQQLLSSALHA